MYEKIPFYPRFFITTHLKLQNSSRTAKSHDKALTVWKRNHRDEKTSSSSKSSSPACSSVTRIRFDGRFDGRATWPPIIWRSSSNGFSGGSPSLCQEGPQRHRPAGPQRHRTPGSSHRPPPVESVTWELMEVTAELKK